MEQKLVLVYASRAINVLITVIFRVFFDDDNELTHFFVDVNPKSANSSKLAKLQKTPKFCIFRNFTDFEIFALLGLKKKFNKIYISFTQFDVIFQENSVWHFNILASFDEF